MIEKVIARRDFVKHFPHSLGSGLLVFCAFRHGPGGCGWNVDVFGFDLVSHGS